MNSSRIKLLTFIGLFAVVLLQFVWLYNTFSLLNQQIKEKSAPLLIEAMASSIDIFTEQLDLPEGTEINFNFEYSGDTVPEGFYGKMLSAFRIPPGWIYELFEPYDEYISLPLVDSLYTGLLEEAQIKTPVVLQVIDENDSIVDSSRPGWTPSWNSLSIDPQPLRQNNTRQLQAYIVSPFTANLQRLLVLLLGTALIMLFVGYCIMYQIRIIVNQNKIAELRKDFSNAMIHDMKTPLTSIMMGTRILRSGKLESQPEKKEKYFTIVEDEVEHLLDLTNKVLTIAKLEQGNLVLDKQTISLTSLVEDLIEKSAAKATKAVDFVTQFKVEEIYADEEYLKEAISNLIENAIKYSSDAVTIEISSEEKDGYTLLHVKDNGLGISVEDQMKIFEKFERGAATGGERKKGVTGFGLGLNYVQLVALAHGGKVAIESIEGEYSQFTICIPKYTEKEGQ